jgi:hypothetical protein
MKDPIKVAVIFVVPADILQMLETVALNFIRHLLKAGK